MAADSEIDSILRQLTIEEKVGLLSGRSMWEAGGVPRLSIPALRMSDGPHGMRGFGLRGDAGAPLAPNEIALAATFDEALIVEVGALLGEDCARRGGTVLLGPCINMQRSPLYGRHFECFSEDAYLSSRAAVAYVRGVQRHVAACAKHLVCNDQEKNRHTLNAVIDERTLREIYLAPFEAAVRDGQVESIMCGYNRLNGSFCTENSWLLQKVLREEWHFRGWFVSDWFGNQATKPSLEAGLNVEMPGIEPIHYGGYLVDAVKRQQVSMDLLDQRCRPVLRSALRHPPGKPPGTAASATTGGAAQSLLEGQDAERRRLVMKRASMASMVLLRNEGGVLPLNLASLRRLAVVGPNAANTTVQGGGSARVRPKSCPSILEALQVAYPRLELVHEPGCLPGVREDTTPEFEALRQMAGCDAAGQARGFRIPTMVFDTALVVGAWLSTKECWRRYFMPCFRVLGWRQGDPVKVAAHEAKRLAKEKQASSKSHESASSNNLAGYVLLATGVCALLSVWSYTAKWHRSSVVLGVVAAGLCTFQLVQCYSGFSRRRTEDRMLEAAERAVKESDACVVVVGTHGFWEAEGMDQNHMSLPGRQEELVQRIAAKAQGPVVVVLNVGSPKEMPWATAVPGILLCHFGGEEMGAAVVDTLFGSHCPCGRLPTTWPRRLEEAAAVGSLALSRLASGGAAGSASPVKAAESTTLLGAPSRMASSQEPVAMPGEVVYSEGLRMGYRAYFTPESEGSLLELQPFYPFGYGLSYTTFEYGAVEAKLEARCDAQDGPRAVVRTTVRNSGARQGAEVAQLYTEVSIRQGRLRPSPRALWGFIKTDELAPGDTTPLTFTLGPRALGSFYDTEAGAWRKPAAGDIIRIEVGASCTDVRGSATLTLS